MVYVYQPFLNPDLSGFMFLITSHLHAGLRADAPPVCVLLLCRRMLPLLLLAGGLTFEHFYQ